jgi:hypothetical protein
MKSFLTIGITGAMKRLKRSIDRLASKLDREFPHTIQTDDFCAGGRHISAMARRDREGSYDVYTLAGGAHRANCGIPLIYDRDTIHAVSLSDAVRILDCWTRAQENKTGFTRDDRAGFGGGAHYKNVAQIKNILL